MWKTRFPSFEHFSKNTIKSPALKELSDFVEEMWDSIEEISVEEAMKETNAEVRRIYFDCIGVVKLFKSLNPTLVDRQVVKKKRTRWDDKNDSYTYEFEDVYELYYIEGSKMFPSESRAKNVAVFAVRCWCTTTNREYWIYVPEDSCMIDSKYRVWELNSTIRKKIKYDAISAIAWTIRIDIDDPEKIYRQGDIIVVKEGSNSKKSKNPYHLSKEQYLSLMYSES